MARVWTVSLLGWPNPNPNNFIGMNSWVGKESLVTWSYCGFSGVELVFENCILSQV